jgi:hypothetical protein
VIRRRRLGSSWRGSFRRVRFALACRTDLIMIVRQNSVFVVIFLLPLDPARLNGIDRTSEAIADLKILGLTKTMLGKLITSRKPILAWLLLVSIVGFGAFVTWAWK